MFLLGTKKAHALFKYFKRNINFRDISMKLF